MKAHDQNGSSSGRGCGEASAGRYPVLVFSHGLGGTRGTYSVLCAELASQASCCRSTHRSHKWSGVEWCGECRISPRDCFESVNASQQGQRRMCQYLMYHGTSASMEAPLVISDAGWILKSMKHYELPDPAQSHWQAWGLNGAGVCGDGGGACRRHRQHCVPRRLGCASAPPPSHAHTCKLPPLLTACLYSSSDSTRATDIREIPTRKRSISVPLLLPRSG